MVLMTFEHIRYAQPREPAAALSASEETMLEKFGASRWRWPVILALAALCTFGSMALFFAPLIWYKQLSIASHRQSPTVIEVSVISAEEFKALKK